jgi:hypothetical protein
MSWQYSSNGGTDWIDIPNTSADSVSLIGNYSTTYTFTPTGNQNGYLFRARYTNGGCFASFSLPATLTVNPTPSISIDPTANQSLCAGSNTIPVHFTGVNTTSVNWTNNNTTIGLPASGTGYDINSFAAVNPGSSDLVATITATPVNTSGGAFCPGSPASFTITVKPQPTITLVTNPTVCSGTTTVGLPYNSTTLSPTTYSIIWSSAANTAGFSNVANANLQGTPINLSVPPAAAPATYTGNLTVSNSSCPSTPYVFSVTVNPIPVVNQPSNQVVCNGASTNLVTFGGTPGSNTSYAWTNNTTSIGLAASGTGNINSFNPVNNGTAPVTATIIVVPTYTLNGVSCNGTSKQFTITVNPTTAIATAPQSLAVCEGDQAVFSVVASGTAPFTYEWRDYGTSGSSYNTVGGNSATLTLPGVTPAAQNNHRYGVVVTGTCGTVTYQFAVLTVRANPTASPLTSTVCASVLPITISANPNPAAGGVITYSYVWLVPAGVTDPGNVASFPATISGTYSVTLTNQDGCKGSGSAALTVNPVPTAPTPGPNFRCGSGTVSLTASGCTGTLKWYAASSGGSSIGTGSPFVTGNLSATTSYWVTCTNGFGCESARTEVIASVNAIPAAPGAVDGANCGNGTVVIDATGCAGGSLNWYTQSSGGVSIGTASPFITPSLTGTTNFYVSCTSNGCEGARSVVVATIRPIDPGSISGNQSICSGLDPAAFTGVAASSTDNNVNGNISYKWYSGPSATGPWTLAAGTGVGYDVTTGLIAQTFYYREATGFKDNGAASGQYTCTVASNVISVSILPAAGISAQPTTSKVCIGSPVSISAGYSNATGAIWQISKNLGASWNDITAGLDGSIYTNFTTATLNIGSISAATALTMVDYQYRLQVGNICNTLQTTVVNLPYNYIWTGSASTDWNNTNNWLAKEIPTVNCPDVYLLGNRFKEPNLSTATPPMINNLHILQLADFTLANGTGIGAGTKLQVAGHITRYPTSTFESLDGTLEMSGTGNQNIDASTFNRDDLENLIVSSTANLALDGPVNIYESVTFGSAGVNLNTNGHLTLKSLSSRTARLGNLNYPSQNVNGQTTVERYLNPKSAWRFLAVPTFGSQTINSAWQEGALFANANPKPGFGTQITSPTGTGFDAYTINPSMKAFNPNTYLWDGVTSTSILIQEPRGYMLFVRGDRSSLSATCLTCPAPVITSTTLRTKGDLYKGVKTFSTQFANDWASVGNPFASQIDLRKTFKTGDLVDAFTIWDSYSLGYYWVGAYQTLVNIGTIQNPEYKNTTTGQSQNFIESGQAFFIQSSTAAAGQLAIKEADKSDGSNNVSFAPQRSRNGEATLWAKLVSAPSGQASSVVDGLLLNFENNYSTGIDNLDVRKFFSPANNLSVLSHDYYLVAERTAYPHTNDTIQIVLSSTGQQKYRLDFEPTNLLLLKLNPYLYDRYMGLYHPIAIAGATSVAFDITQDEASKAINRFCIVFKKPDPKAPLLAIIAADRNPDRTIQVTWKSEDAQDVEVYELERSGDGKIFKGIITADLQTSSVYNRTDVGPLQTENYYRVKAIRKDGLFFFSNIMKVNGFTEQIAEGSINVYPNPVTGKQLKLNFYNQPAGKYRVQVLNQLGQVLKGKHVVLVGREKQEIINLGSIIKPGQYQINILAPNGETTRQNIIVE